MALLFVAASKKGHGFDFILGYAQVHADLVPLKASFVGRTSVGLSSTDGLSASHDVLVMSSGSPHPSLFVCLQAVMEIARDLLPSRRALVRARFAQLLPLEARRASQTLRTYR